jgi:hypothetical protein
MDDLLRTSLTYDGAIKATSMHWLNCSACKNGAECDAHFNLQMAEADACQEWRKALGVSTFAPNDTGQASLAASPGGNERT